ncbi:MAG: response regulator [gamma proteobacterium symbiont of Taylorina sp.]|nr:response regulator [gamma proteobacterium symbiont of Taylorina sp.]
MEKITKNKLLLVDDEPINIRQIGHLLESDYDIVVATSGQQAIDIASIEPQPDLILLDVLMPEMDGYEVCQHLKGQAKTLHIPIIFLTANHKEEDESRGLELGAVDYIIKPFRPLVDLKRIKTHINLHKDKKYLLKQFVDTLPFATFVVGDDLSIKSYNHLSQQLLDEAHSDFSLVKNKLIYARQASLLPDLIENLHHLDDTASLNNADNIRILKSPRQSYRIFVTPLSEQINCQANNQDIHQDKHQEQDEEDLSNNAVRQYVIYINKYNDFLHIETQLKEIYDLTTAEASLANGVVNGLTLEEIAGQGDLKYSTLKSYLKIIFQKTGTRKQHELVSAILRNFTCTL